MKYESPLCHLVTISRPYRRAVSPMQELELILANAGPLVKEVIGYEDVLIPTDDETALNAVRYEGRWCVAALRVTVLVEGEFTPDEIYKAFDEQPEKIRVFVDYVFD